jgi:hypothetical protein
MIRVVFWLLWFSYSQFFYWMDAGFILMLTEYIFLLMLFSFLTALIYCSSTSLVSVDQSTLPAFPEEVCLNPPWDRAERTHNLFGRHLMSGLLFYNL